METQDLAAPDGRSRARHGVVTMIDNSWATPVFQQPITLGVDLVVHSASKYIGGHSDTVAGVVAGPADLIDTIRRTICPYLGGKLAPFEAWLLLRGLRTLAGAHEGSRGGRPRHRETARRATQRRPRLSSRRSTARWPSACTAPRGLFSFEFGTASTSPVFCDALACSSSASAGAAMRASSCRRMVTRGQAAGPNSALDFGVPERMVRLHVGLEGTEALWADIAQAIEASGGKS